MSPIGCGIGFLADILREQNFLSKSFGYEPYYMVYTSCIIGHIDRAVSIVGGLLTKEIKLKVATGFCKFSKVIFLKDSAIDLAP